MPRLHVVDSSGWIEYFAEGPNAQFFSEPIEAIQDLMTPTKGVQFIEKKKNS